MIHFYEKIISFRKKEDEICTISEMYNEKNENKIGKIYSQYKIVDILEEKKDYIKAMVKSSKQVFQDEENILYFEGMEKKEFYFNENKDITLFSSILYDSTEKYKIKTDNDNIIIYKKENIKIKRNGYSFFTFFLSFFIFFIYLMYTYSIYHSPQKRMIYY